MDNVIMQNEGSLLTPGISQVAVAGRSILTHEECKLVDIALHADKPYRKAGRVRVLTLDSLLRLVRDRVDQEDTDGLVLYVNENKVTAVLNRNSWQDDTVEFAMNRTAEWQDWLKLDGSWMSQERFCDFLEDQEAVIAEPCGTDLLRLVSDFRQRTRVTYGSSYRGRDGQISLSYCEEKTGANKEMELPEMFLLHLPVIKGAEALTTYGVKARLRVRVDKETHELRLQYNLVKPNVPVDNAVSDMAEHLRTELFEVPVFEGTLALTPRDMLRCE